MAGPQTIVVNNLSPCIPVAHEERRETGYKLIDQSSFIAHIAWWVLDKLGALTPHMETVETWTFVESDQRDLMDTLMDALDDSNYDPDDVVFVVGAQEFSDLTHSPVFTQNVNFRAERIQKDDPYRGRQIFSIPIHVVRNVRGCAAIPRVMIETKRSY